VRIRIIFKNLSLPNKCTVTKNFLKPPKKDMYTRFHKFTGIFLFFFQIKFSMNNEKLKYLHLLFFLFLFFTSFLFFALLCFLVVFPMADKCTHPQLQYLGGKVILYPPLTFSLDFFIRLTTPKLVWTGNKIEGLLPLFWGPALHIPFKIFCNPSKRKG
jgi:hypothetical protein